MTVKGNDTLAMYFPGIALAVLIAAVAYVISLGHSTLDPHVVTILISIVLGNLITNRETLRPGISFCQSVVIPAGIILYGSQVDFQPLQTYGLDRILLIVLMVLLCIAAASFAARRMRIARRTGLLVAAGTALCGASAIIVLSPVIEAEKEDTSVALLAITVMGLVWVILYPLLQDILSIAVQEYTLLCATTLPQMGQVKAAVSVVSEEAVPAAVSLKLIRVTMILPVAIVYSLITRKDRQRPGIMVPWFLVAFLCVAGAVNAFPDLSSAGDMLAGTVSFFFSIAIASIGLSIDLETILDSGPRPLVAAFLGWAVLILFFAAGTLVLS